MSDLVFYTVPPLPGGLAYGILRTALEGAKLPASDLDEPGRTFFGLSDDRGLIGYIGLEGDGPDRLLRSLIVQPTRRGEGHGLELVRRLESICREQGVDRLHLLTTTASAFFAGCGYVAAARSDAPLSIADTAEFKGLCPASATYLVKAL